MHRYRNALMAALLVSATWFSAATPVSASPRPLKLDQTQPQIMADEAAQAAAPYTGPALAPRTGSSTSLSGMKAVLAAKTTPQREVLGFVNAGNLGSTSFGYTSWNYSLLSTVVYFGIQVNPGDGHLVTTDTGWTVMVSQTMTDFMKVAHANGVRVLMSLNLHDFSTSPTSAICQALQPANRAATVSWTMNAVQSIGFDGVSIDYEGNIATCADGITNRDELVSFASEMRAAMAAGSYLSIDTYSGSAEDNLEFFNITGLAPSVDSFFVMAYDMDFANYNQAPLNCSSFCFNPMSPLNTYRFNVTKSMSQYTALVPASKVILGQPLYGRRGCVPNLTTAHQYPIPNTNFVSPTYAYASTIPSQSGVSNFTAHRDPGDGVSEWDTWYDSDWSCNREQYFDDPYSLAAKFNVVNVDGLRGVGLFSLDYAGGISSLWSTISTYFACPVTLNVASSVTTTEFNVGVDAGTCSVSYFDAQVFDQTLNQGWGPLNTIPGGATAAIAEGYAGHSYQVRVRAHSTAGVVSSWAYATTAIDSTATASLPFTGLYTLDAYGGVHADSSGPLNGTAYWPGWAIVRAAHAWPGTTAPQSGFVLDGWGGLHPYGAPGVTETSTAGHYWRGWDIARDFAFLPDGTGGFVLDGYGGLHAFRLNGNTAPLAAQGAAYFGSDVARKVVIFADGTGGYVLDRSGGIHPFGINGPAPVTAASLATTGFWPGKDIARDIELIPGDGGHSGYVLDLYGGMHPFHATSDGSTMPGALTTPYWYGKDLARAVFFAPKSATEGYVLDAWGGEHPFGGAPVLINYPYWPNTNLAVTSWGA